MIDPVRTREGIISYLKEYFPDDIDQLLLLDGFDDAFVGVMTAFGSKVAAAYDTEKIIEKLMSDSMDYDDAVEYFEFNIIGAYVGEHTPVFLNIMRG